MSICYEFALECQIKRDVSQEVIDTLKYMTRSQEYDFDTPELGYPLFKEDTHWKETWDIRGCIVTVIKYEWRTIITNQLREGEQYLPGEFGSAFDGNKLSFRRLSRDDEFCNVCWFLFPWLASISDTTGFVGYYRGDFDDYPTLVRFEAGRASVHELIPIRFVQGEPVESDNTEDSVLRLELESMTEIVRQELLRQAENPKMSLEAYISSVVARRDAMNAALEVGEPPPS